MICMIIGWDDQDDNHVIKVIWIIRQFFYDLNDLDTLADTSWWLAMEKRSQQKTVHIPRKKRVLWRQGFCFCFIMVLVLVYFLKLFLNFLTLLRA